MELVVGHRNRAVAPDAVLQGDELCAALFATLRRSDQRVRARDYLSGLLATRGRKTIRTIAANSGADEQRLHHFISSSTWEWGPVREALTDQIVRLMGPQAWVVRPLMIPKAGRHSVGVGRQAVPGRGGALNGQLAFGAWAARETAASVPVQWRLHLPELWVGDVERRRRADIPDSVRGETADECATATALSVSGQGGTVKRPVVLDTHVTDPRTVIRSFVGAGVPLLARLRESTPLVVADRSLPGFRAGPIAARHIVESVQGLRRPLETSGGRVDRTMVATVVRVRLPGGADGPELVLIGQWHRRDAALAALWLAAPSGGSFSDLARLGRLVERVAQDEAETGERVGVRDFEGRSFRGWHRHMTLASVAHAVVAMEGSVREHDEPRGYGGRLSA
ncbi:IS701 family transposase [Streptomyces griseoviridis]